MPLASINKIILETFEKIQYYFISSSPKFTCSTNVVTKLIILNILYTYSNPDLSPSNYMIKLINNLLMLLDNITMLFPDLESEARLLYP